MPDSKSEKHYCSHRVLWGVALSVLLTGAGTVMGAALTFSLDARTEVRKVEAGVGRHNAKVEERWLWTKETLNEIKADLRAIRNGEG